MSYIILFDFGSTFTKATVVSTADKKILHTTRVPSTVKTDASVALNLCLREIEGIIGRRETKTAKKIASSSAAGGLRMAVCGLSRSLSISAGRNVSFGAGAKIVYVSAGVIKDFDLKQIVKNKAEMVLLCGGYESGTVTAILENARLIADSSISCPIIYGGNSLISHRVKQIIRDKNKECFLVHNIIPQIGQLDTTSAEETIRNLFMQRIVKMKGLDVVLSQVSDILMPTPTAVLRAGELLAKGTDEVKGMGDLIIADVGGATTDIHSYAENAPFEGARIIGAKEPYSKRTVEGDLGMRESADTLLIEVGAEKIASYLAIEKNILETAIWKRVTNIDFLADTEFEKNIDTAIAHFSIETASRRHCGKVERVLSANCTRIQTGKNLTTVNTIVGTGGEIINSNDPSALLRGVLKNKSVESDILLPEQASIYLDGKYVLYAVGLLRGYDESLAQSVLSNSIRQW